MNVITTIAVVVVAVFATITGTVEVLKYFHVESAIVVKFFTERARGFLRGIYHVVAFILSLMAVYVLISIPILLSFTIEAAIIEVLMLWSLLGIWSPVIKRLQNTRINNAVKIVYICLIVVVLVGFWIVQWPAWQIPALLSSPLVVLFVYYVIDRFIVRGRRRIVGDK